RGGPQRGGLRRGGGYRARVAGVRGGLLGGGRREPDLRLRPAGGRGHALRDRGDLLPGLAGDGVADVPGGTGRRQRVLGVVVRHAAYIRDGRLLLLALPHREVEVHAGDRAANGSGTGNRPCVVLYPSWCRGLAAPRRTGCLAGASGNCWSGHSASF